MARTRSVKSESSTQTRTSSKKTPPSKSRASKSQTSSKKKTQTLPPHRQAVIRALTTKFNIPDSEKHENMIYQMCERLSNDYEEGPEQIYIKYAYEKVGELLSTRSKTQITNIIQDISDDVIDWNGSPYAEFRKKLESENTRIAQGIKVEKGVFVCANRYCRSKECWFYQQQDRGCDESMSTYVICTKCGNRKRYA